MVAGGTDAPLVPSVFAGTCATRAMSTQNADPASACRPFDRYRDGYVMAEGAAVLVLETLEHAGRRGAGIYGEIIGFGLSNDAYHITAPEPDGDGLARAMKRALEEAGIHPAQVDYLNAHGTGTVLGDRSETRAIKKIFGRRAYSLAVSSTKSMTGHLLGAAGALEMVTCLLAINEGYIPPTINYRHPDPECDLNYVPNHGTKAAVNIAMNNT
ncbi:beta-ketoacyl-[acyl-carrier-protein] synthase family protein, partial [Calderihabitans maritimus]|uniref:beta-ketoacyl-[acyl-carrier-protein] synthase family protein n=1 Tax=Calderihabitans maritimus TaxID=1246530 RepID=UPI001177BF8C